MTDQPPQPENQSPGHAETPNPATQPISAAASPAPSGPTPPPKTNVWHQATSTHGGRWAIGIAAVALVGLIFLSIAIAGFLVLRNHDRFAMMGQRTDGYSRGQFGRGPGGSDVNPGQPRMPGAPGMRGGQGLGELGGLLGGTALHGDVTATANGVTQPLVFQRGQVTAISATSISLKSSDGFVGTYGRTASTTSPTVAPATGGQAFVLARASDKVAITIRAM